jgi:hypothetical protein
MMEFTTAPSSTRRWWRWKFVAVVVVVVVEICGDGGGYKERGCVCVGGGGLPVWRMELGFLRSMTATLLALFPP